MFIFWFCKFGVLFCHFAARHLSLFVKATLLGCMTVLLMFSLRAFAVLRLWRRGCWCRVPQGVCLWDLGMRSFQYADKSSTLTLRIPCQLGIFISQLKDLLLRSGHLCMIHLSDLDGDDMFVAYTYEFRRVTDLQTRLLEREINWRSYLMAHEILKDIAAQFKDTVLWCLSTILRSPPKNMPYKKNARDQK